MGSHQGKPLADDQLLELQKETGFNRRQIIRLYSRFLDLDKNKQGHLTWEDFNRIPELAYNPLGERIIHAFFIEKLSDDKTVNFRQFLRTVARFRPVKEGKPQDGLNSRLEKLMFAFKMYDLDGDNRISSEELQTMLIMMVGDSASTEQLGSIADRALLEADIDGDGTIEFDEFVKIMEKVDVEQTMSIRFFN